MSAEVVKEENMRMVFWGGPWDGYATNLKQLFAATAEQFTPEFNPKQWVFDGSELCASLANGDHVHYRSDQCGTLRFVPLSQLSS